MYVFNKLFGKIDVKFYHATTTLMIVNSCEV
jgi:hypothetical protein